VLGLAADPDVAQRLARMLELQQGLVEASRALDAGAELPRVLAALLDRVIDRRRGLRVVVVDHEEERGQVLARYPLREERRPLAAGEESFSRSVLTATGVVRERVSPGGTDGAIAAPPNVSVQRLGVPLAVGGRAAGTLLFEEVGADAGAGFSDEDRLVLESVSTLAGAALATRSRARERRELERLRSDFISRVSHELRTPLTIISGFAGTIAAHDETLEPRQRHEMLDRIISATVRLEHLVDDVLSLASIEAGTREPNLVVVPVVDVIDLVVHDQGGTGRVRVDCPPELRLSTDPSLARQTLGPVVQNALQHGEHVHVEGVSDGDGVRIVVTDDGPGIPHELGERVFDRFVRGDDRSPGMGLGLAVARSAGAAIGAVLTHEPVADGARFVLRLPDLPR
jgi:K+-sensing histidine kinase KdpD